MRGLLKAWFRCCTIALLIAGVLGLMPSLGNHHDFNRRKYEDAGLINVQLLLCTPPSKELPHATLDTNHAPPQLRPLLLKLGELFSRPTPRVARPERVQRLVSYHRRLAAPSANSSDPLI
jgi:hypothetical protein